MSRRDRPAAIEVLAPGPLALVQDRGRPGYEHLGVSVSGAADRGALALANRLVANPAQAAGLELLLGGLRIRVHGALMLAVTGAVCPVAVNGVPAAHAAVLTLGDGAELDLGVPETGLRSYLAVRGGIDVPPVLGSRSRDTLAGLGPEPLAVGDLLPVGPAPAAFPCLDSAPVPGIEPEVVLPVLPGPRTSWVTGDGLTRLCATRWTVSAASDRAGLRLDGPPLERSRTTELASEGLLPGAVQVPADGRPIVLGPDAGVTGGYPVVAVVRRVLLDRAAQARPGSTVRFVRG